MFENRADEYLLFGKRYIINGFDNPYDVDPAKIMALWGHLNYPKGIIRICSHISNELWLQTLLHEMLNVIGKELQLDILDKGTEEDIDKHRELDMLAMALASFLIENGAVEE
jgi:hypothetical protein